MRVTLPPAACRTTPRGACVGIVDASTPAPQPLQSYTPHATAQPLAAANHAGTHPSGGGSQRGGAERLCTSRSL